MDQLQAEIRDLLISAAPPRHSRPLALLLGFSLGVLLSVSVMQAMNAPDEPATQQALNAGLPDIEIVYQPQGV